MWPIDEVWNYHCGRNEFNDMDRYVEALDRRYGSSESVEEFLIKAQVANYEAIRPMFESFAVNRPLTTGLIQWMLNSAWPETYWQLYDWYLMPNGAFYGTRAASQPLNLSFNYADETVYAVNDSRFAGEGLTAVVRAFDLSAREISNQSYEIDLPPGQGAAAGVVRRSDVTDTGLVPRSAAPRCVRCRGGPQLLLAVDQTRRPRLREQPLVRDPDQRVRRFHRPRRAPRGRARGVGLAGRTGDHVHLSNPTDALAFFVELRVVDADGSSILPVLWDDNYVSILPGESRELTARFPVGVMCRVRG